jgi:hypothetical protein
LKKIGEEATEVVMAGKDGDRERIVAETADLWFHSMVALAYFGLEPADVLAELERREGLSGSRRGGPQESASARRPQFRRSSMTEVVMSDKHAGDDGSLRMLTHVMYGLHTVSGSRPGSSR